MEEKITVEIPVDSLDVIIDVLSKFESDLYGEQVIAKANGDNELRDKLLRKFMTIQDLLSIFVTKRFVEHVRKENSK